MSTTTAEKKREQKRAQLQELQAAVDEAESVLEAVYDRRDRAMIASHGDKRTGGLSYDEMAATVGLSKGRVIQIVQGKSKYSKAQYARQVS